MNFATAPLKTLSTTESYNGWKNACKRIALKAECWPKFFGDKDIAGCRFYPLTTGAVGPHLCAEWDGTVGTVEQFID